MEVEGIIQQAEFSSLVISKSGDGKLCFCVVAGPTAPASKYKWNAEVSWMNKNVKEVGLISEYILSPNKSLHV